MVILDASFLVLFIEPDANPPLDPTTKKPVEKCKERIEYLIARLTIEKATVAVPAPSLPCHGLSSMAWTRREINACSVARRRWRSPRGV